MSLGTQPRRQPSHVPPLAKPFGLRNERELAHARAVRARGAALPPEGLPSVEILDSWARCLSHGLDCAQPVPVPVVDAADLRWRRESNEFVRRLAQVELETLAQQIAGSNFLLAFADRDGVILDLYADNRFSMSNASTDIVAGSAWSESIAGTNGLGTALATGEAVAVTGLEHYFLSLGDISCTAAPVRDAAGEIAGVLDASSYFASRQQHTKALVQMAAAHIENGLFVHQMRAQLVLAVHPRPEFLGTPSAGLLAFDPQGRLLALNARGRRLLQGLDAQPGVAFESLFGEAFEHMLARAHRQGELRLRDAMGSTLAGRCLSRLASPWPTVPWTERPALAGRGQPTTALPMAREGLDDRPGRSRRSGQASAPGTVLDDAAVAKAYRLAEAASRLQVPMLIHGETGTGKELLARHVHEVSGRSGAFVAVNCGALPAELVEAELFGYAGGAFTGARREGSLGLIASADGGTLLLDEMGELPLALQAALLRFLDDQHVRPVGGTQSRRVNVQLLAATHVDLDAEVSARRFRADLLYRLATVRLELPPLRERGDFAAAVRVTLGAIDADAFLDDDALALLAGYSWPGNFRELRAVLTRALLSGRRHLGVDDVASVLPSATVPRAAPASALQRQATEVVCREFERCGRSVSETARRLGVSRTTVYRHLREAVAARSP